MPSPFNDDAKRETRGQNSRHVERERKYTYKKRAVPAIGLPCGGIAISSTTAIKQRQGLSPHESVFARANRIIVWVACAARRLRI